MKLLLDTESLNINCKMTDVQESFLDQPLTIDHAEDNSLNICNGSSEKEKNGIVAEHNGNFKTDEKVEGKKEIGEKQQIHGTKIDSENKIKLEDTTISMEIAQLEDPNVCLKKEESEVLTSEEKQLDEENPLQNPSTQKNNTTSQDNINEDSKESTTETVNSKDRVIETRPNNEDSNSAAEEIKVIKEPVKINEPVNTEPEPMQIDEVIQNEQQIIEHKVSQTTVDTKDDTPPMNKSEELKKDVVDDNLPTISETEKPQLDEKMETCEISVTETEGLNTPMEIDAIVSSDSNISNNITDTVTAPTTVEESPNCATTVRSPEVVESTKLEEHSMKHVTDDTIESAKLEVQPSDVSAIDKNNEDIIGFAKLPEPSGSTIADKVTNEVNESVTPSVTSDRATANSNSDDVTKSATPPESSEPVTEKNNDVIEFAMMELKTADVVEPKIPQVSSERATNKTSDKIIDSRIIPEASKFAVVKANDESIESTNSTANKTNAEVNDPPTLSSDCTNVGEKVEDVIDTATTSVSNECCTADSKHTDETTESTTLKEAPVSKNIEKTSDDIHASTIHKESLEDSITNTTEDLYTLFECKKPNNETENVTTSDKPEEIVEIDCTEKDQVIDIDSSEKDSGIKEDGALDTVYNCEDSSDGCTVVEAKLPETPDTQKQDAQNKTEISNKEKIAVASRTISGLSNNLDIISDEEDETPTPTVSESAKENSKKEPSPVAENKCINLDDDDDIMVIDEEVTKENTNEKNKTKEVDEKSEEDIEIKEVSETTMADEDSKAASILEGLLSSEGRFTCILTHNI